MVSVASHCDDIAIVSNAIDVCPLGHTHILSDRKWIMSSQMEPNHNGTFQVYPPSLVMYRAGLASSRNSPTDPAITVLTIKRHMTALPWEMMMPGAVSRARGSLTAETLN